jgi:hypothetical protein
MRVLLACALFLATQIGVPKYEVVADLPSAVDGQPLRAFAFDPAKNRLYLGANSGLFWTDLSEPKPRVKGPIIRKNILRIEIAPELSRVFYTTPDEVGYADLDRMGESVRLAGDLVPTDLVYEPTRREVYVASRDPRLLVFDATSGRKGDDLPLPGWYGVELESIPGRVFLSVGGKDGLYTIDAATHVVAPWPVDGRIVTPARIEADPSGQYLFLAYYREIVAIDIARAAVIGRAVTYSTPAIAFDPGERVLIATWNDNPPPTRVVAFRAGADGFTEVARYKNPPVGRVGVEPTSHGFVQAGSLALVVWSSRPGQMFQPAGPNGHR